MTAFVSKPLPDRLGQVMRLRLASAHRAEPFSALDPRAATRRVATVITELGLTGTVYRGGLDLRGSEVDHVWLDVDGHVIDVAFPLFADGFVDVLRDFVAGDAEPEDVAQAAAPAGLEERVLGVFPISLSYRGAPIWSARHR
jgi:hypothetical protein